MELKSNMQKSLVAIPITHLLLYIAIGLNIFVFRQIIVFVYLSFIPGFVLLKILRLKETSVVDTVLFSTGLSITFLMFIGLLINDLYPILGVSQPLSTIPLAITLSLLTLILFFVGYRQDFSETFSSIGRAFIDLKAVVTRSAILVLPALGVIGALYVSQPILSLLIIAIATLISLSVFSAKFISSKSYPLVIFAISMALALQILFISKYIMGSDAQLEYYVFRSTTINGYWHLLPVGINPAATVSYDSMLSITILPAIYSALLNINGEIVFKALYPFVFSLVPVVLYRICERQMGKSASLLSALFLISSPLVFYGEEALSLNRQIVAEFFLVLSILILLDNKISFGKRRLLLIVFGAALIVSHYSLTYLYLAFISSIYVMSKIKHYSDRVLNGTMVFLLFVMAFSWYSYSIAPLESVAQFFYQMFSRFWTDIYNPVARSSVIFQPHPILTIASIINWVLFYTVHFFIVVGILRLLFKPEKTGFDSKYRIVVIASAIILLLCVAIPNFAPALNFSRFYAVTILLLAPCFVLGGETLVDVSENLLKRATSQRFLVNTHTQIKKVLLCTVLIGYFLSQSGFINFATGASPLSLSLNYNSLRTSSDQSVVVGFHSIFIPEQEVFGAVWLSKQMGELSKPSTIYADSDSRDFVLTSIGLIPRQQIQPLTNTTMLEQGGFIYLGQLNVVYGRVATDTGSFNVSETSSFLTKSNLIYSNGNCEIWCGYAPG